MSRRQAPPPRGYGLTPWSRAVLSVVDRPSDVRRMNKARSYFRDRKVIDLRVRPGRVTALVQGSQLDPFETTLTARTVEPATVVELLRSRDATDDLVVLARGRQPVTLGELVLPTEPADIEGDCSCPDDEPRCIHVLAVTYELCAQIDARPALALTLMGADTTVLLKLLEQSADGPGRAARTPQATGSSTATLRSDYYGAGMPLPPLPLPPPVNVLTELDVTALGAALRASGTAPADVAEAIDELAELYDRFHGRTR
ncbi:SWIM zinc finger family protein [Williamsia sp. CHRR-6]|uniref:SWIM zinc finger family protein n=1 Tax=Williamsia sp. CHRR-6 TaxID=2835871 RepID=UPI001BDB63DF|nr:SWIM zinc finger family protein [Williamsia sp. CHRR-6]MBT0567246.1 SWIM zinc finger family protein [Williamsia sp. CHRR-6]